MQTTLPNTNASVANCQKISPPFRSIHYLGSKLRIVEGISTAISSLADRGDLVCDLFAGSCCVSNYIAQTHRVVSVDIQEYSRVIGSALLQTQWSDAFERQSEEPSEASLKSDMRLLDACKEIIEYEEFSASEADNGNIEHLYEIIEHGSILAHELRESKRSTKYEEILKRTALRLDRFSGQYHPAIMTRYFGGLYFSFKQATEIDMIRNRILRMPSCVRDFFLAALLSCVSDISNTVGKQFAQPLQVRNKKGNLKHSLKTKIIKDRSCSVSERYQHWVAKYRSALSLNNPHKVIRSSFEDALKGLSEAPKVVYADPPYTRDHYSRFYHVLETLCLYDSPLISQTKRGNYDGPSRALYRTERHQSPFCLNSKAPHAFNALFQSTSALKSSVLLSYSPYDETKKTHPRVITIDEITRIGRNYYSNVDILCPGKLSHSKLNSRKLHLEALEEGEILIQFT